MSCGIDCSGPPPPPPPPSGGGGPCGGGDQSGGGNSGPSMGGGGGDSISSGGGDASSAGTPSSSTPGTSASSNSAGSPADGSGSNPSAASTNSPDGTTNDGTPSTSATPGSSSDGSSANSATASNPSVQDTINAIHQSPAYQDMPPEMQHFVDALTQLLPGLFGNNGGGQSSTGSPEAAQNGQSQTPSLFGGSNGGSYPQTGSGSSNAANPGQSFSTGSTGYPSTGAGTPASSAGTPSTNAGAQTSSGPSATSAPTQNPTGSASATNGVSSNPNIPQGATNVAGRDQLNLNKPIYVPMVNGDYDPAAIKAIGDQSLSQAGLTAHQAQTDGGPHAGNAGSPDGSFTIANGYAAGIRNGAAAIYGANQNGYTSLQDHKYAVTQAHIESGADDGTLNGQQSKMQNHVPQGGGSHGVGPIQIDSQWHNQTDANMPIVAYSRAYGIANQLGSHQGNLRTDGLAYNQGFVGGQGQTVGHEGHNQSYGAYWDQLVNRLNSGNFTRTTS